MKRYINVNTLRFYFLLSTYSPRLLKGLLKDYTDTHAVQPYTICYCLSHLGQAESHRQTTLISCGSPTPEAVLNLSLLLLILLN